MKIYYISPRDMRKNRADPVHIMRSCSNLSKLGVDVTLVTPLCFRADWKISKKKIWELYDLRESFDILELPIIITEGYKINLPNSLVRVQKIVWFLLFYVYLIIKSFLNNDNIVIYSKCYASTLPLILLKKIFRLKFPLFFEKPDYDKTNNIHKYVCVNANGIVVGSKYVLDKIIIDYGISAEKLYMIKLYSDIDSFNKYLLDKFEAREKLFLPIDKCLVVYTGKIGMDMKEPKYIIEAASKCQNKTFLLVGARDEVLEYYCSYLNMNNIGNVILRGFQKLSNLYYYVQAADILISYYENDYFSATQRIPAKLTIYVCARRPLIVAEMPSMREFLNDDMAYFVPPENPDLLAKKIEYIWKNREEAQKKAEKLYEYAIENNYIKIIEGLKCFIEKNIL